MRVISHHGKVHIPTNRHLRKTLCGWRIQSDWIVTLHEPTCARCMYVAASHYKRGLVSPHRIAAINVLD